jgi:hypothetical protein
MKTSENQPERSRYPVEFDTCHHVISALMNVLQYHFKHDTRSAPPIITAQGNLLFIPDPATAEMMTQYISVKLCAIMGFSEDDFRFVPRSEPAESGVQRLRLEFVNGIDGTVLKRMSDATLSLEKDMSAR